MEVRLSNRPSESDPGIIALHYMELHAFPVESADDITLQIHQPYIWSIDTDAHEVRSTPISQYAISGDGTRVCTMKYVDHMAQFDMWAVSVSEAELASLGSFHLPKISPVDNTQPIGCSISLSWNGSMVAYIPMLNSNNDLRVFKCLLPQNNFSIAGSSQGRFEENELLPALVSHRGSAKFHITSFANQDTRDELFVTCDGVSVKIYGVFGKWTHIKSIPLSLSKPWPHKQLIASMRGKFFMWTDQHDMVLVCDLETGLFTSYFECKGFDSRSTELLLSNDGSMVAMRHDTNVQTYCTSTGTRLASMGSTRSAPCFIANNSRLFVSEVTSEKAYGRGRQGLIVDAVSLCPLKRATVPIHIYDIQPSSRDLADQTLYSLNGSRLDYVRLQDTIIEALPQARCVCDEQCHGSLSPVSTMGVQTQPGDNIFSAPSKLQFIVCLRKGTDTVPAALIISVADSYTPPRKLLAVSPKYKIGFNWSTQEMIMTCELFFMVWSLPLKVDGDVRLLLVWWIQPFPYNPSPKETLRRSQLVRCPHQQIYMRVLAAKGGSDSTIVLRPTEEAVFSSKHAYHFLNGLVALLASFDTFEEALKKAVLSYVGRYINHYPNLGWMADNVLSRICETATVNNLESYSQVLRALLDPNYSRWVPKLDLEESANPVSMTLERAKKEPHMALLTEILIDYCFSQAREEKDLRFLHPVTSTLHILVDQQQVHPELAERALRGLAYFPVKERAFIIDHHVLAHPPERLWRVWSNRTPPLYKYENPVMRLDQRLQAVAHDPQNDNFSRDLLVASFDMLWRAPVQEPDTRSPIERISSSPRKPLWIITLLHLIWVNFSIKKTNTVLFELRVNKSVCHFVTIIIRIMSEIRVFFLVFAIGILAFTIAILHLLRGCPVGECVDALQDVKFPKHFYGAISSTYFFMGGIWDPVNDEFAGDNWAFHTMMIVYFFFTTILLLNVLIALINVAFSAGDGTWLLVWTENRLRYIESAENISYHIPGFRELHNYFPDRVFYSASPQEQKDYWIKHLPKPSSDDVSTSPTPLPPIASTQRLFGQNSSAVSAASTTAATTTSVSATVVKRSRSMTTEDTTTVDQENTLSTDDARQTQEKQHQELKKELEDSRVQLTELKEQLQIQQRIFEERLQKQQLTLDIQLQGQFAELKDILTAAMAK
ncbi:hypothetical protein EDD11_004636 [Mortierella claussenii]|nr:hypothetical protein EDD11_004636 [Mortierella claussenii]